MRVIAALLFSMFGILLFFFSTVVVHAQLVKIRAVSASLDVQYLPAYVAQAKGYFKQEGLDVELIVVRGGRLGLQALAAGDVHFVLYIAASLPAIWNGTDLKILAQMTNMLPFSLMVRPDIRKVEDLKGKKVGVSVGATTFALVHELLKLNGIDPDKGVEYVNISGNGPKIAALQTGLIAAAPLAPPTELKALKAGFKRLLSFGDVLPEMSFTGLVAAARFIREEPRIVEKMVRGLVRGTVAARDDREVAIGVMQNHLKMTPYEASESYNLVRKSLSPGFSEVSVKRVAELISSSVGVPVTREPKEYLDLSFFNRVVLELGKR